METPLHTAPPFMDSSLQFSETYLGPASLAYIQREENSLKVEKWVKDGAAVEDAVLRCIFEATSKDSELTNEFLNYFLQHLLKLKIVNIQPSLRRMVDTGDLVQSVFTEIWGKLPDFEFTTRGAFISLLCQRLKWKASNENRRMKTQSRREDLRASSSPEKMGAKSDQMGPLSENLSQEEQRQMAVAIFRLPPRDRQIVTLSLQGFSHSEIGERMGLEVSSARKALNRAVSHMRKDIALGRSPEAE